MGILIIGIKMFNPPPRGLLFIHLSAHYINPSLISKHQEDLKRLLNHLSQPRIASEYRKAAVGTISLCLYCDLPCRGPSRPSAVHPW